jgi:ABC-type Mn2+/Zn2+ transport system ATPase subunit
MVPIPRGGDRIRVPNVLAGHLDIVVLDEFVADQDPGKREYFFRTLLPKLKAAGKTVVVTTRDLVWVPYCGPSRALFRRPHRLGRAARRLDRRRHLRRRSGCVQLRLAVAAGLDEIGDGHDPLMHQ